MTRPDPFASVSALGITPPRVIGRPPQVALPHAIKAWRDTSVTWLRGDDPDSAGILASRTPPTEIPRMVVVGETNRGKSSLVNGILGMPGLSPVDAGVATCSYLVFAHSDSPYAVARFGGGMADVTFPLADLPVWATVAGEPDLDIPTPRWIEVGVPAEVTRSLTIVDTPGVGGLVAAHAELAAEAAAAAAALLFVVDASAPLTRGELAFLALVADRVDAVHFVVTKTDAYRGWREIVEADRQLLARYAPRFTDAHFHPVSSRLAEAAAGQADAKIRQVLVEQSGIAQLANTLVTEVAAAAALLSEANTVRTSITVMTGAVAKLEANRLALTAGAAQAEVLRGRREELLNQRKTGGRSWQVMLRAEIQRARVDLTHETAREVREAAQMFRGSIDQADSGELKQIPFHIDAYAQTMTARAHGRLIDAMGTICRTVLSELFTPAELTELVGHLAARPYAGLATRGPDKGRNLDESIMTLSGASMGFTMSRMAVSLLPVAALPTALGIALAPISVVIGGAAAFYLVRSRKRMVNKQHLKQWLMEILGEAKAQIDQNIAEQFVDADMQLTLALDDVLTKQVGAVDAKIREVDGALKLDATERAGRLRAIDERKRSGTALISSGEELLTRIRAARGAAVPAGPALQAPRNSAVVLGRHAAPVPTPISTPTAASTGRHAAPDPVEPHVLTDGTGTGPAVKFPAPNLPAVNLPAPNAPSAASASIRVPAGLPELVAARQQREIADSLDSPTVRIPRGDVTSALPGRAPSPAKKVFVAGLSDLIATKSQEAATTNGQVAPAPGVGTERTPDY